MFVGKYLKFQCDFCQTIHEQEGFGLPLGMMYLESNILKGRGIRHVCGKCLDEGRHGEEKPIKGGSMK